MYQQNYAQLRVVVSEIFIRATSGQSGTFIELKKDTFLTNCTLYLPCGCFYVTNKNFTLSTVTQLIKH